MKEQWAEGFSGAITVCDANGAVLGMNGRAAEAFAKDGGRTLIGKSLFDCHPEPARGKLKDLLRERRTNVYTIEKRGVKKLICQAPWFAGEDFHGLVEISIEIPDDIPHFVRKD